MNYSVIDRLNGQSGFEIRCNEPLALHTTFKVGGPADRFVVVHNEKALAQLLQAAGEENLPVFILGNGSNLLVSDEGYRGVVITLGGDFRKLELEADGCTIKCGAGVMLSALCKFAFDHSLSGLEFAWGIPGSAGGAVYMNAGAYGGEMKDVLVSASAVTQAGAMKYVAAQDLDLSYRHSVFSGGTDIITSLRARLVPGNPEEIRAKMDDLMGRRRDKQPLEYPSAGSTFKRPEGYFAAALIEQCGLKGVSVGGAQVSQKHSGFVINTGSATAADILGLIAHVRAVVLEKTGVYLETEVEFLGM